MAKVSYVYNEEPLQVLTSHTSMIVNTVDEKITSLQKENEQLRQENQELRSRLQDIEKTIPHMKAKLKHATMLHRRG